MEKSIPVRAVGGAEGNKPLLFRKKNVFSPTQTTPCWFICTGAGRKGRKKRKRKEGAFPLAD